jgi:NADPH2:quinone reductase
MVRNKHQNKHELPFAPGMTVAGTVSAIGANVGRIQPGQRVLALVYDGGLAEQAVAPERETFVLPDNVSWQDAAGLVNSFLTPYAAIRIEAQARQGETLLVLGAGGTVSSAAVAIGKALGLNVIAAASTDAKLTLASERGAAHLLNYSNEDLLARARAICEATGVDIVFDPVGGELYEPAFKTLGWGGRYLVIGFAGGAVPQFAGNRLLVKNRKALGFVLMYYRRHRPDLLAQVVSELLGLVTSGKLKTTPEHVLDLDRAGAAIDAFFERSALGCTVVNIA